MSKVGEFSDDPHTDYHQVIAAGAASLAPDEYWCIGHDEGPLLQTASKDLSVPIRIFCEALDMDWDEAVDAGYRLAKVRCDHSATADAMLLALSNIGEEDNG